MFGSKVDFVCYIIFIITTKRVSIALTLYVQSLRQAGERLGAVLIDKKICTYDGELLKHFFIKHTNCRYQMLSFLDTNK